MRNTLNKYFLGANTSKGFMSFFDSLYNPHGGWHAYIIKGGPGTGKSSFMKYIAERMEFEGIDVEYIYCSSDPDSLDAIIMKEIKTCFADGTPPHVIEPKVPGASEEIIYLGNYWNGDMLREDSVEISKLTLENSAWHKRSVKFIEAASLIKKEIKKISMRHTDNMKMARFIQRFTIREFGNTSNHAGTEKKIFLSAVTPIGVKSFFDSLCETFDKIIIIDDPDFTAELLLENLRRAAMLAGLDIVSCICPISPLSSPEHIIIPEKGLAVVSSNAFHTYKCKDAKYVHMSRFTEKESIAQNRRLLNFYKKTMTEFLNEAVRSLENAKTTHDKLEKHYIEAMDFDSVRQKSADIANQLISSLI